MNALWALVLAAAAAGPTYPWLETKPERTLEASFAPPPGFKRVAVEPGSFGAFLRALPLEPSGTAVRSFDGALLHAGSDPRIAAVVALDVGTRDLQQCADSIIRLHAEWRWSLRRVDDLGYKLTSGDWARWSAWRSGERPSVKGSHVTWASASPADDSHASFRHYLDFVFTYAGTASLAAYSPKVARAELRPGDFFVLPAKRDTGHAVLVLDVAEDGKGHRVALVGQGFMPAQSFQVLATGGSPWFSLDGETVATPFWAPFPWSSLRRLP